MKYRPAENIENGKARIVTHRKTTDSRRNTWQMTINKKVITHRLVVNQPIVNLDEQWIGQYNLDHGKDRPPQDRKLYNLRRRQLNIALKITSVGIR